MPTLKEYLIASYGARLYKDTNKLKQQKKNEAKAKNQWIFLQRCSHHNIIPKSLNVRTPLSNEHTRNLTQTYERNILTQTKNDAKRRFFSNLNKVKDTAFRIKSQVNDTDYETIIRTTDKAREYMFQKSKKRLVKKFNELSSKNQNDRIAHENKIIKKITLNLCNDEIPEHHKALLDLGPKFVPSPRSIPYMDIIAKTEAAALRLQYEKQETSSQKLRQDVLRILKMAKPPKTNLTKPQQRALNDIRKDETISIYPFDKGSGLVRISNEDVLEKIHEQMGTTSIVEEDPTQEITRKVQKTMRELKREGKFTEKEYKVIYPSDAIPPRLYGTIKAHKPEKNYPARLIVSTIGTPTYGLSKYLVQITQPTLNKNETRLVNSRSFKETAQHWDIEKDEIQVSYDVVNLYPQVPIQESIDILLNQLLSDDEFKTRTKLNINDVRKLLQICLSHCYFLWENNIHVLENSGPIGLALMVVMAESFLQYQENKAIQQCLSLSPQLTVKSFKRYVDDSHSRFNTINDANRFLEILNQQHPNIKYTMETENEEKILNFLDLQIINDQTDNKYKFKIHRKNAITNVQIKPHSSHDPKIINGVFKGFVNRAFNLCSKEYIDEELEFLVNTFIENGYNEEELKQIISRTKENYHNKTTNNNEINNKYVSLPWVPGVSLSLNKAFRNAGYKPVFKSGKNLRELLSSKNKPKLPSNSYPGVYKIDCECGKSYVGETKKRISSRLREHEKYTREKKWDQSAIAEHSRTCTKKVDWSKNTKTLHVESNDFQRKVREALEIQYYETAPKNEGLNQDIGQYVTTNFWKPMFSFLRNKNKKQEDNAL